MLPLLADGFVFNSPNDDHIDLKTYKERRWPNAVNIKKLVLKSLTEHLLNILPTLKFRKS